MRGLSGDWKKLEQMLAEAGSKFKANVDRATKRAGSIMVACIVARIEAGKVGQGLSRKYEKAKAKAGYAVPGILIRDTELIKRGIKAKQLDWQSGMVTVMRTVKGGSGLVNIGAVHEFGSPKMKIPARPFAEPGAKDAEPNVVREYGQAIEDTFK